MRKRIFVLWAALFFCFSSCSGQSVVPTFSDVYENGLGLTESAFEKRYPEWKRSDAEISEKNGFTVWSFPERENILSGAAAAVTASFWDGRLDRIIYTSTFDDCESVYPVMISAANDLIDVFGEPSPEWIDEQPLNRYGDAESFRSAVEKNMENGIYMESNHWMLSAEKDSHDYRVDFGITVFESGQSSLSLCLYDWKGMEVYNSGKE